MAIALRNVREWPKRICTLRGLARPLALPDDRDAGRHNLQGGMP
jgi:hypothetical protein